jgi:hypothetical protein
VVIDWQEAIVVVGEALDPQALHTGKGHDALDVERPVSRCE